MRRRGLILTIAALAGSLVGFGTTLAVQARHALKKLAALALEPA